MIYNLDSTADRREQSPPSRDRCPLQRQLAHPPSIRLFLPDHRHNSTNSLLRREAPAKARARCMVMACYGRHVGSEIASHQMWLRRKRV